jgi:hypothetical protein
LDEVIDDEAKDLNLYEVVFIIGEVETSNDDRPFFSGAFNEGSIFSPVHYPLFV